MVSFLAIKNWPWQKSFFRNNLSSSAGSYKILKFQKTALFRCALVWTDGFCKGKFGRIGHIVGKTWVYMNLTPISPDQVSSVFVVNFLEYFYKASDDNFRAWKLGCISNNFVHVEKSLQSELLKSFSLLVLLVVNQIIALFSFLLVFREVISIFLSWSSASCFNQWTTACRTSAFYFSALLPCALDVLTFWKRTFFRGLVGSSVLNFFSWKFFYFSINLSLCK